ncbi:hypothetical protein RJZ90_007474 [Blastomyces dermatitidis]
MGEMLRSFETWFEDQMIPNNIMRPFTIQLLLVLDYAHDCGVIHTELYLPNNPADLADFDTSTDPSTIRSQPLKWDYFRKGANLMKFNIALGDWGVASWTDSHLSELIQPVAL